MLLIALLLMERQFPLVAGSESLSGLSSQHSKNLLDFLLVNT